MAGRTWRFEPETCPEITNRWELGDRNLAEVCYDCHLLPATHRRYLKH